MHGTMFTILVMEISWSRGTQQLRDKNPEWVSIFGFDIHDEELNVIVNNKTRLTFDKDNIWVSPHMRWHRESTSVWDLLVASTKIPFPEESEIVTLHRDHGHVGVTLWCRVSEIHPQSRQHLGDYVETISYSLVSARCVLELVKMEIN